MTGSLASAAVVGYGLLVLAAGGYFVRRQGSSEAFFLAGRTLGTFEVFATTYSTFLGTGLLVTLAAFGYRYGVGAFALPGLYVPLLLRGIESVDGLVLFLGLFGLHVLALVGGRRHRGGRK